MGRVIPSVSAVLGLVPVLYRQRCPVPNELDKDGVSALNCGQEEHEGNLTRSMGRCVPETLL